ELGRLLVASVSEARELEDRAPLLAGVAAFVAGAEALREAKRRYPWLEVLLVEVLRNEVYRPSNTLTPLVDFGEDDARKVGGALALLQLKKASPAAAVEAWIAGNPALGELKGELPWFEDMMLGVSLEFRERVPLGVQVRAGVGAGVSAADGLSDAYIVDLYYKTGRPGTANALLGMMGANLVFQLVIVTTKCHSVKKDKWRTMLFEVLSIVTFSKPGVDAYRVASGAETTEGTTVDPLTEMVYTKAGELVFEAVPGLVLQLVAALNAKENTTSVFVSLVISTASAALTGTTIFWDIDTDPQKRKGNPDWIGIVPDLGRGTAFATVFAMCAFQIFAKAAATALLAVTDSAWLWYYVIGDYGLYFAYLYRHTLWSWTSGRQCVQDYFIKGKSEEDKFGIFSMNLLLWESDIGNEMKALTRANWARWSEEKPAWFKPERVPDQFIPAAELEQLGYNRKRKGSAAGSIRESFREEYEN
ncbi:hypothetical protein TeGR_g2776, partial [Tetraparma gracilis]